MFETLMKFGGYRVDYFQRSRIGSPTALGLYVLGDLPSDQSYSRAAKHHLFSALCLLREQLELENLVAVYLDVNSPLEAHRPAYQQLKQDMKAGFFHRLFVTSVYDLTGADDMPADFWNFYRELPYLEIFSIESGRLAPVLFSALTDYQMVSSF